MNPTEIENLVREFKAYKKEKKISFRDVECPIKCGNCCLGCGHHSLAGCNLKRKNRPLVCNLFLCGDGARASDGFKK